MQDLKVRYSDDDLLEFKGIVEAKLTQAQEELTTTEQKIADLNENGFNQQGGDWSDDSGAHTDMEMMQRMIVRQLRHVQDLRNALLRIQNKTYGICIVTGLLIDKNRLRLVPHATKSIDGKAMSSSGKPIPNNTISDRDPFEDDRDQPMGKPVEDQVRMSGKKNTRQHDGDEWEPDNDHMESSASFRRKNDDDDDT